MLKVNVDGNADNEILFIYSLQLYTDNIDSWKTLCLILMIEFRCEEFKYDLADIKFIQYT